MKPDGRSIEGYDERRAAGFVLDWRKIIMQDLDFLDTLAPRYFVDAQGRQEAVVIPIDAFEKMLAALEDYEDLVASLEADRDTTSTDRAVPLDEERGARVRELHPSLP